MKPSCGGMSTAAAGVAAAAAEEAAAGVAVTAAATATATDVVRLMMSRSSIFIRWVRNRGNKGATTKHGMAADANLPQTLTALTEMTAHGPEVTGCKQGWPLIPAPFA